MYHPAIIVAYYLDPRYRGQALTEEYPFSIIAQEASQFVSQDLSGKLAKELLWYNNKTGPFSLQIFWESEAVKNPIDWWNGLKQEVPVLGDLAVKLMLIPASAAASERNWSNFGFIQNIKRNRLTNDRTFKLVSIYANLRLSNNQELNDNIVEEEEEMEKLSQLELEILNNENKRNSENENESIILLEESEEGEIN
jgi:hypothetical protein